MAITKKPEKKQIQPDQKSISSEKAMAFVKMAAVNQGAGGKESEEKKKPLLLRLWQSEIDQIDEAVVRASKTKTHPRRRLNRHAWIVEAILEKIKIDQL